MIFIGGPKNLYIDLGQMFVFLFITLGPGNFVRLFAAATHEVSEPLRRQIAFRGIFIATVSLLLAAFVGTALLKKWLISPGAIAMAGGIILLLVAVRAILTLYDRSPEPEMQKALTVKFAASPLAIPSIATPYGVATVIFFLTLAPQSQWTIVALILVVMAIDLVVMLFVKPLLRLLGPVLELLAIVLAVLQVALSIQIVITAIRLIQTS